MLWHVDPIWPRRLDPSPDPMEPDPTHMDGADPCFNMAAGVAVDDTEEAMCLTALIPSLCRHTRAAEPLCSPSAIDLSNPSAPRIQPSVQIQNVG